MRSIIILGTTLLCCTIIANAKTHSGEKIYQKKELHNYNEPKRCKEGSCGFKKVEKYKENGEKEDFRWNKNFKNHKNNIYDVDKKSTESVYKPKYKKVSKVKEQTQEFKKPSKKNVQEKKKKDERKMQMEKKPSAESSEISKENVSEPSKEIQCDVSENTCRIE